MALGVKTSCVKLIRQPNIELDTGHRREEVIVRNGFTEKLPPVSNSCVNVI